MPAADPAWPLVVLDALHPVANNTPLVFYVTLLALNGTLPPVAGVLDDHLPLVTDVLPPAADVLPGVTPVLDDTLPLVDPVLGDHPPGVERAVQ